MIKYIITDDMTGMYFLASNEKEVSEYIAEEIDSNNREYVKNNINIYSISGAHKPVLEFTPKKAKK